VNRVVIVGGGIVGLATARALVESGHGEGVVVIEKEPSCGRHQTGHNSGVIHSGIYYRAGSMKARLCAAGNRSMIEFCVEQGIRHEVCGKLIVATDQAEVPGLVRLHERGVEQGISVELLGPAGARDREPHVRAVAALWVPPTGIVDFGVVAQRLAAMLEAAGAEVRTSTEVTGLARAGEGWMITTSTGELDAATVVTCAGLHSDRVARMTGADPGVRILPFRGEYYELAPSGRHLVRGLVYPVPDPELPFLGVHLTRGIDGTVHAGPNAVLGFRREAYRRSDVDVGELREILGYPGTWKLARRHWRAAVAEQYRSLRKAVFLRSLQRLVPALESDDLLPAAAGVRAQAVDAGGGLVDDFLIVEQQGAVHVCNAPSPAATAALEIGRVVAAAARK
jgi:(S)-2-hydroxyglutarate dehydrogenase